MTIGEVSASAGVGDHRTDCIIRHIGNGASGCIGDVFRPELGAISAS